MQNTFSVSIQIIKCLFVFLNHEDIQIINVTLFKKDFMLQIIYLIRIKWLG